MHATHLSYRSYSLQQNRECTLAGTFVNLGFTYNNNKNSRSCYLGEWLLYNVHSVFPTLPSCLCLSGTKGEMAEEHNLRKMKANSVDSHTANTYEKLWQIFCPLLSSMLNWNLKVNTFLMRF